MTSVSIVIFLSQIGMCIRTSGGYDSLRGLLNVGCGVRKPIPEKVGWGG